MPQMLECETRRRRGRKKRWSEDMQARFAEGTFARIAAVLVLKEDRTDFVRLAVERELAARGASSATKAARKHAFAQVERFTADQQD